MPRADVPHTCCCSACGCVEQRASQGALVVKNPPANAEDPRDASPIPGSGSSPRERHGNPLQYACLENPTVREVWRATVRGVAQSWTRLSTHTCGAGKLPAPTLIFHTDSPMKQEVKDVVIVT